MYCGTFLAVQLFFKQSLLPKQFQHINLFLWLHLVFVRTQFLYQIKSEWKLVSFDCDLFLDLTTLIGDYVLSIVLSISFI